MTKFSEFQFAPAIHKALEEKNFLQPTPVQAEIIPRILGSSKDIIAIAQTGTGKTAAFGLPVISKMNTENQCVQTVVLSPTRELAMQIASDIKSFSKYMKNLNVVAVYGGSSIQDQIYALKRGAHVVVGTPGRTVDLIERGILKLGGVKWMILDEADEMLKMGFTEDISAILEKTPADKQTLLFSATMSKTIEQIGRSYMRSPDRIDVKGVNGKNLAISHQYMLVPAKDKVTAFKRYKELNPEMYGIIFCRTKKETQEIGDALLKEGCPVSVLHGDIEQRHRTRIMDAFKRKETTLLVATDVAARGIDVTKLTHVIHIGVPDKFESYVHRSGRTGRANEKGISLVLAHLREQRALKRIAQMNGITFEEIRAPKREDIINSDISRYIESIESDGEASPIAKKYVDEILKGIPKDEMVDVAKKVLLHAIQGIVAKYPEQEMDRKPQKIRHEGKREISNTEMKTLVVSAGRRNSLTVPHLLGMINEVTKGERIDIGQIEIADTKASFEVPERFARHLCKSMSVRKFKGQRIIVREGSPVKRSARR